MALSAKQKQQQKAAARGGLLQLPLPGLVAAPKWEATPIAQLPQSWRDAKRIALDIETFDPYLTDLGPGVRRGAHIVGYSFAIEDGPAHYVPMRHEAGGNLDPSQAINYLRDRATEFSGEIVGHNLQYELDFLTHERVNFAARWFRDVMIAEPLINEFRQSYSLAAIATYYGLAGKDEGALKEAARAHGLPEKGGLWRLHAGYVGEYGIRDVTLPLEILRKQETQFEAEELWEAWNVESALLPVLVRMKRRGIRINERRLSKIDAWTHAEQRNAADEIRIRTGVEIAISDFTKPNPLAYVLSRIGVTLPRTEKGQPNIDKRFLESLNHPVADAIVRGRAMDKLRGTYIKGVRDQLIKGRIHPTINQMRKDREDGKGMQGTISHRCSAVDPSIQNQPIRDEEIGIPWRAVYQADEGTEYTEGDYSQQEPRMIVHFAEKAKIVGGKEAAARYRQDPDTDFHTFMAELTGLPRKVAKGVFLARAYGAGDAKICQQLGLPTEMKERVNRDGTVQRWRGAGEEGAKILEQFERGAGFIKKLSKAVERAAKLRGYVKLIDGRRCRFGRDADGNFDWTHLALNRIAQGSGAVQTKRAMIACDAAGLPIFAQIHDAISGSMTPRQAQEMKEIMETSTELQVPSRVDLKSGDDWGSVDSKSAEAVSKFYGAD